MDGAGTVAGHGHADGAEGQPQRAVGHRHAGLLQLLGVVGVGVEARQEIGFLAGGAEPTAAP